MLLPAASVAATGMMFSPRLSSVQAVKEPSGWTVDRVPLTLRLAATSVLPVTVTTSLLVNSPSRGAVTVRAGGTVSRFTVRVTVVLLSAWSVAMAVSRLSPSLKLTVTVKSPWASMATG